MFLLPLGSVPFDGSRTEREREVGRQKADGRQPWSEGIREVTSVVVVLL